MVEVHRVVDHAESRSERGERGRDDRCGLGAHDPGDANRCGWGFDWQEKGVFGDREPALLPDAVEARLVAEHSRHPEQGCQAVRRRVRPGIERLVVEDRELATAGPDRGGERPPVIAVLERSPDEGQRSVHPHVGRLARCDESERVPKRRGREPVHDGWRTAR